MIAKPRNGRPCPEKGRIAAGKNRTNYCVPHYVVLSTFLLLLLATGWTVQGSNPGGDEIFRAYPDRPWVPPSLLYNGYRVFPGGKKRPGRDADPLTLSSSVGHERVELYLYSPYGPYGLYRVSVPVQGCTLPLRLPLPLPVTSN
jgi:hypothetical protein